MPPSSNSGISPLRTEVARALWSITLPPSPSSAHRDSTGQRKRRVTLSISHVYVLCNVRRKGIHRTLIQTRRTERSVAWASVSHRLNSSCDALWSVSPVPSLRHRSFCGAKSSREEARLRDLRGSQRLVWVFRRPLFHRSWVLGTEAVDVYHEKVRESITPAPRSYLWALDCIGRWDVGGIAFPSGTLSMLACKQLLTPKIA